MQRNDPSRPIRDRETAPTPPHHILSPDHRRGSPMTDCGACLGASAREAEKTTRCLSSSSKFLGFSTGPCFPLCGMSGASSWCFFTPMARVFSRTWALVQDLCPTKGKWRQDSAAKIVRQPQLHNPRPPDDAKRLGCHRGIFHHRGSGYTSALSGFDGNTTLLRAKGTRHVGKKYMPPQLSTTRPPDDCATMQDLARKYLAARLG